MLKPQDVILAFHLSGDAPRTQGEMARALGLSQPEVSNALKRLQVSRLLLQDSRTVVLPHLIEFCVHGVKYAFPAQLGRTTRGVPTAALMSPLKGRVSGEDGQLVWPAPQGNARAPSIAPLHKSALAAAESSQRLHELLALLDAIRVGKNRMREIAETELRARLVPSQEAE